MSKLRWMMVIASWLLAAGLMAANGDLTVQRIYSDPSLDGLEPANLKFSPDGKRVTFLKSSNEDFERQDLWEYHLASGKVRMLVASKSLQTGNEELSDEEKARRERKRLFKTGIVDYFWSADGKALLFPLSGDLYYYELASGKSRQLTKTESFETDPRFSPQGSYVSFIRNQNLYVVEVSSGRERQITRDGGGAVKFGMAEFVAQEEMDRYTGYWWAPDESAIAFTRTDETPVEIAQRYEIYADSFKVYDQRYPRTGTNNALVSLGIADLSGGPVTWVDMGQETDIYLARVNWLPGSQMLAVQRQSRDQKTLDLLMADRKTGKTKRCLQEKSDVWLNLHNQLHFLRKSKRFIWASERDGFQHLYLYHNDGHLIRQLTQGNWVVEELLSVDEASGTVYFTANATTPLETHLFTTNLETARPKKVHKVTREEGVHNVIISPNFDAYVDKFSSHKVPLSVSLHAMDGKHKGFIEENKLAEDHPYFPYLKDHVAPEFGTIKAADGQIMHFRLIKPHNMQKGRKYPVIVDVYGGPHAQRVRNSWKSRTGAWSQVMAKRGFAVFALDNRGSANRGTAFEFPIHRHLGRVEVEDQIAGVNFLKTLPFVDGNRIGIFGWSYGGYMTLMCMMKAPDVFHAGVSVAPVTDWHLYDTHYTERYLGHPADNAAGYKASNVFDYADGLRGPVLIVHGMADDNVLFTNSTKLYQLLQSQAIPFEMMNYPGHKHSINGKMVRTHLFNAITQFFDRNLGRERQSQGAPLGTPGE